MVLVPYGLGGSSSIHSVTEHRAHSVKTHNILPLLYSAISSVLLKVRVKRFRLAVMRNVSIEFFRNSKSVRSAESVVMGEGKLQFTYFGMIMYLSE